MSEQARATEQKVFRQTHLRPGRHVAVSPENSSMRHLAYARIRLDASTPSVSFRNARRETGLICLSGRVAVKAAGRETELGRYDAMYVPRGADIEAFCSDAADVAEFSCDVEGDYPATVVRYAELDQQPGMKFSTGGPGASRQVRTLLGKNIAAGPLLLRWERSDPANWTSWPPHEHAKMLEEIYVYFEMPAPAYGIQLVYTNTQDPELVTVVRDGDAVLLPGGYHPNVSVPGHRIAFLWAMAAHREVEDRQYGVFNVQPEFKPPAPAEGPSR